MYFSRLRGNSGPAAVRSFSISALCLMIKGEITRTITIQWNVVFSQNWMSIVHFNKAGLLDRPNWFHSKRHPCINRILFSQGYGHSLCTVSCELERSSLLPVSSSGASQPFDRSECNPRGTLVIWSILFDTVRSGGNSGSTIQEKLPSCPRCCFN